jgi:hypothetical protein
LFRIAVAVLKEGLEPRSQGHLGDADETAPSCVAVEFLAEAGEFSVGEPYKLFQSLFDLCISGVFLAKNVDWGRCSLLEKAFEIVELATGAVEDVGSM